MPKQETFVAADGYENMTAMKSTTKANRSSTTESTADRPLVVVLEDDSANAWGLSLVLQDWGYRTVIGASVEPVVAQLDAQEAVPDAAICDFNLAGDENGVTAAQALRERYGNDITVVIVTGSSGVTARRQAETDGFPVLNKPVNPDTLHAYLPAA